MIALALLALAVPPSPDVHLACVVIGANSRARGHAAREAARLLTGSPAKTSAAEKDALAKLRARLASCRETLGWGVDAAAIADEHLQAGLTIAEMRRRYRARGIDLTRLDRLASARPDEESVLARATEALRLQGLPDNGADEAGDVAFVYLSLLRMTADARARFATAAGLAPPRDAP